MSMKRPRKNELERMKHAGWLIRQHEARGLDVPAELYELQGEAVRLGVAHGKTQRGPLVGRHSTDRAAVVGDIHGEADKLAALLARIETDRTLVVVGDLCDRGPATRRVLDQLLTRGAIGVLGNHDQVFLCWLDGDLDRTWLLPHMGGRATLASYGVSADAAPTAIDAAVPASHREFLGSLALALDLEVAGTHYWVVHAGLPTRHSLEGVPFEEIVPFLAREYPMDLMWGQNDPEAALSIGRPVIMGHTPRAEPLLTDHVIAIDTGCATTRGGRLTALLLPERTFITV